LLLDGYRALQKARVEFDGNLAKEAVTAERTSIPNSYEEACELFGTHGAGFHESVRVSECVREKGEKDEG